MAYRPRVVDQELRRRLASMGAVVIEGPKACGKTIVRIRDGRCAAFEVKLGHGDVDRAATNLIKLRDTRIDLARAGSPALLAVIIATGLSYMRPDGVGVVAIGALGP